MTESSDSKEHERQGHYGDIAIETAGNVISFEAGSLVSGTVHVNLTGHFPSSGITVGIHGYEKTKYLK